MKSAQPTAWWRTSSADEIRDRQARQLRRFLKTRVLPFSPFYRRNFAEAGVTADTIRSLDDLALVPFTSKADLLPKPRDFLLLPDQSALLRQPATLWQAFLHGRKATARGFESEFRPLLMTSTTGRSSQPIPFLYTAYDLDNLALAGHHIMEVGGTRVEWRHANLFPFAPHLAFWQAHYASVGFGAFMVGTGGGKALGTEGNIALIEKIEPEVAIGMPTFLYHVLGLAVAEGHRWPQLKLLVLGGEKVPAGMRRKLRALCAELGAADVKVVATYAFTEAKMGWIECPAPAGGEPSGYHLWPELGLVEIVDPSNGRPVGAMQPGEIVFTALDSRGTVVVRYRTGDRIDGGLTYEPCLYCGRRCPRLVGNISRVSEMRQVNIDKVKGTLVDFNQLEHVLDDVDGVGAWQIELRKAHDDPFECDEVIIHAASSPAANRDDLERTISHRFAAVTELRPNRFEWHDRSEMQERQGVGRMLKEAKILDRRPGSNTAPAREVPENFPDDEHSAALLI